MKHATEKRVKHMHERMCSGMPEIERQLLVYEEKETQKPRRNISIRGFSNLIEGVR